MKLKLNKKAIKQVLENESMTNKLITENALNLFNNGYNCAQSVLLSQIDKLNITPSTATNLTSGFGAGMGGLQKTCGAVTGAYLTIGLYYGAIHNDNDDKKAAANERIKEFHQQFLAQHNTSDCLTLLNCDLNTEEGQSHFSENKLKKTICEECIKDAITIIDKVIQS